ncbi:hypothetical protein [Streptomyces sp. F001]|uniref:hypothetical protein n=1 Tax=Streptomyces sp. F001 TaxID=1510026 RepID=UPI001F0DDCD6|nr:hypothetical protein [Streptomyces sp. F001]
MTTTAFEHSAPRSPAEPCAVDESAPTWPAPPASQGTPTTCSPPNPAHRLTFTIDPRDQRRLDLHAALTAAGIPPHPDDRDAIDQLSALPASINAALQRWLHHTP